MISSVKNQRQAELDYLRGIACLLVVLFHLLSRGPKAGWTGSISFPVLEPLAQYGYLGVQLFFMISGYVIYKSARGRTVQDFFKARFWRLYPAYWTAMLVTTLVVICFDARQFQVSVKDFFWNLTMFQGWAHAKNIDGAYWSLLVEMMFYIFVGLAIHFKLTGRTYALATGWLLIAGVNLVVESDWINKLFLAPWAPYFVIGILAFTVREGASRPRAAALTVVATGIALLQLDLDAVRTLGHPDVPEILLVLLLIILFVWVTWSRPRIKVTRLSSVFGDLTYPLYLLHQIVGYVFLAFLSQVLGAYASLCVTLFCILILSFAIHRWIEVRLTSWLKPKLSWSRVPFGKLH